MDGCQTGFSFAFFRLSVLMMNLHWRSLPVALVDNMQTTSEGITIAYLTCMFRVKSTHTEHLVLDEKARGESLRMPLMISIIIENFD